jgi:HAD superfamily hydrolase (TIGR01549 family)
VVSPKWSQTTKRLVIVGLLIAFAVLTYLFRALLPLVAIALVLAYILKPLADLLERRAKVPRVLSVLLVLVGLVLIVSTIPATVVPYLVDQVTRITVDLTRLANDIAVFVTRPILIFNYSFDPQDLVGDLRGTIQSTLQELIRPFAAQTLYLLFGVASSLIWILSALIIAFYLIRDADSFRRFLDDATPPELARELQGLRDDIGEVWKSFFRGQVLLGIIIGIVVWIAMSIIGLPNAGLMGLLAGLLEVIPTFGPVLATIPALFIAVFQGSTYLPLSNFWFAVLVLGIYAVIQQIENAYLVPRVMGGRLNLHPVVVFVGVLAGAIVGGVVGVLLAAPIIATARVLLSYTYAKLLDRDPFPPEEDEDDLYPGEIDAILFDLDGTLVETDDKAVELLASRLAPFRRILPGRDQDNAARGFLMALESPTTRILGLLDRMGLDDDLLNLPDRLRKWRCLHSPSDYSPVVGVVGMLRELHDRYKLAIVTTRSRTEAQEFVDQQGLAEEFDLITGREDTWRIKPHPSPVRHTAEQLGVPVERCLMVGDTTADIAAARSAGARSVGVTCGFGHRDELERAGADLILDTTSELLNWM